MPNREEDPRGDSGEEDSYSWLYDGAAGQSNPPDSEGSDPTRSAHDPLPPMQLPPPGRMRQGSGDATPPQAPPPGGRSEGGKRKRRWPKVVGILVLVWIVFLVAVPIWAWGKITKVDAQPDGNRPADQPGTTYLLVGSDSRKGLTKEQRKKLATGDAAGRRTDTIMLMHVGSGPTLLMSVPRDSIVPIPGHGTGKINSAFAYGGPKLVVRTIEKNTGIRVDDYVEVGFGGFVNVVDALNGVEICPKQRIKDKDAGLNIKKGCQNADGATALGYARSRHTYASQDLQRVQSQREVLGAIAHKAKSPWTVINPLRYRSVLGGAASSLSIGDNVGPFSLAKFAWNLSSAMGGKGLNCTVPIRDTAVHWDRTRALKLFGFIKADQTDNVTKKLCTKNGLPG